MQRPLVYAELRKVELKLKAQAEKEGRDTSKMLSVVPMQYFGNQVGVSFQFPLTVIRETYWGHKKLKMFQLISLAL